MKYKNKVKKLIERGANPKLFEMPAIAERIKNTEFSPDSVKINSDGTFDFGRYSMRYLDMKEKECVLSLYLSEDDRGSTFKINKYGIEVEMSKSYDTGAIFDCGVSSLNREDGAIFYNCIHNTIHRFKNKYFDVGDWEIDSELINVSDKNVDRKEILKTLEDNIERITAEYPLTAPYYEVNKDKILENICVETNQEYRKMKDEIEKMKDQNEKLQYMLSKSLKFVENIRNNKLGKLFFGKQANEILGEKRSSGNFPEER